MSLHRKKQIVSLLAAPVPAAMFWLGGYDFDARGVHAVAVFFFTLFAVIVPLIFPE